MSRECEDNRWLDILVSVKAQVPLKYFWRIEVVGHSRYSRAQNLENYSTISGFGGARSLEVPPNFPLYFRLFTFSKGSNTFFSLRFIIHPVHPPSNFVYSYYWQFSKTL